MRKHEVLNQRSRTIPDAVSGTPLGDKNWTVVRIHQTSQLFRSVPEWSIGADCKSAAFGLRWFESIHSDKEIPEGKFDDTPKVQGC